jgi:redox-sensitive bicupin YhaK (pirin superfamily)
MNYETSLDPTRTGETPNRYSPIVEGAPVTMGPGCRGLQFRYSDVFGRAMSPFVLIDHFEMWQPTFDVHPHAGMSAVTLMFEDTRGKMRGVDSIDHQSLFGAGDLHWTLAGRGILHTQLPADADAHIHALQIFVNLPERSKSLAPDSFMVSAAEMPVINRPGMRLRVVAGQLEGQVSPAITPEPVLMVDGYLAKSHETALIPLPADWNAWVYVVRGNVTVDRTAHVKAGQAICVGAASSPVTIGLQADRDSHFVLLAGARIDEPVVQHGPFVFTKLANVARALADLDAGRFGQVGDFS